MSFFDSVYDRLFKPVPKSDQIILHELIKRDSKYAYYYQQWSDNTESAELIRKIDESYTSKMGGMQGELNVHILKSPYSNGFAISFDQNIGKDNFQFVFDWFADKIESNLGYRREVSDRIVTEKNNFIEYKEKHYLKPNRIDTRKPIPQLYGNIHIEYISIDNEPNYIKLLANTYSDRLFEEPYKFEELIKIIFNKSW